MNTLKKQAGLTMIEILITVFILVVGFLGLANLQLTTMANISATNQHFLAASLAHDMGEYIQANAVKYAEYNIDTADTIPVDCETISCGNIMSKYDLWYWYKSLTDTSQVLPNATGKISFTKSSPLAFGGLHDTAVIEITWDERHALKDDTANTHTLEVLFK